MKQKRKYYIMTITVIGQKYEMWKWYGSERTEFIPVKSNKRKLDTGHKVC